jgi:hypothetical protein
MRPVNQSVVSERSAGVPAAFAYYAYAYAGPTAHGRVHR